MPQQILALDIGAREVRAAAIETTFRDYRVTGLYETQVNGDASLAASLRALLEEHDLHPDTVLVTIPSDLATQRTIFLPFRDKKKLSQTVSFELETQVPFGLDDVVVDYQVLQRSKTGSTVIAGLVQKRDLEAHLAALAEVGLDPKVVDFGPLCCLNLLGAAGEELPETYAFVEVSTHDCCVALYRDKQLVGIRSIRPPTPAATNGSTPPVSPSAESLVHDIRWTLMVLNEGPLDEHLPCILAGEPSEYLTEVAQLASESIGLRVIRFESMPLRGLPGVENGQAPAFARPLGLALREVAPTNALGLNFRRGEFTYHRGQAEMREALARIGALASIVLLLVLANLYVNYRFEQAHVQAYDDQIAKVFHDAMPEAQIVGSPVAQLETEIDAAQKKLGLLANTAPVGNLTAIDLIHDITSALPSNLKIDTEEYTMDPDSVRVRGRVESFESVETLKKQMAKVSSFRDIQVKDSKATADGKAVEFRLIMYLNKPGQQEPAT